MPSFRSICLIAATAFAAFAAASPVVGGVNQGASLIEANNILNGVAHNVDVHDTNIVAAVIKREPLLETRDTTKSLPVILTGAHQALLDVQVQVKAIVATGTVSVDTVRPCLDKVHGILLDVVVSVKLLSGKPLSVVLGVVAVVDVAALLCAVLTLVVEILVALVGCVGVNAHIVVGIVVDTISVVLCELLTLVLGLVGGLLLVLLPLVGGILNLLAGCGLSAVLKVLVIVVL
ncbi:hypothetical protein C0991_004005 [Blastosporella zonata]|nr:hypothetical protein C0991_004005 [Blastosporella zonata]